MFKYSAFGLKICSEIFFPELTYTKFNKCDLLIRYGKVDPLSENAIMEGNNFKVTKNSIYRFWDEIGVFKINNGSEIIVNPSASINQRILRSFILGTVFASLLYQRGLLILHASAVNINNEAIAFLGDKGCGKSTTAMAFCNKGYPLLADDYIAVDFEDKVPSVYPGFPSLRLSHKSRVYGGFDSRKFYFKDQELDKIHVHVTNNFIQAKVPLKQIYLLKRGENLKNTSLSPQESLIELIKNTFGISRFKKSDFILNFNQCAKILEYTNLSILEVPDSLEEMYELVNFVKVNI